MLRLFLDLPSSFYRLLIETVKKNYQLRSSSYALGLSSKLIPSSVAKLTGLLANLMGICDFSCG